MERARSMIRTLAAMPKVPTIADRFDPRSNGITGLRLFLALSVLVLHAWPVMGERDPVSDLTSDNLAGGGELAVLAFFGLSGFLLVDSRRRAGPPVFLWHRALRILPAYWVCIVLVSVLVGWAYAGAAVMPWPGIGGYEWAGFASLSHQNVDASLWTLAPEITCYLVLALCPVRALRYAIPVLAGCLVLGRESGAGLGSATTGLITWSVMLAFAVGAALNLARGSVPLHGGLAGLLLVVALATLGSGVQAYAVAVGITYAILWLAVRLPVRWRTDVSYGVYVYAFPVTQFAMLLGFGRWGPVGLALVAVAVTVPIALLSWRFVERPALSVKGWPAAVTSAAVARGWIGSGVRRLPSPR